MGQQPNHVVARVMQQPTNGGAIRRWRVKQRRGGFNVRAKIAANEIGDRLRAGEIQIFFRTEVVRNSRDVLPGLCSDVACRGVQSVFPELG
ncbi:hypothetical protein D3C72_2367940 [compost metagenome]